MHTAWRDPEVERRLLAAVSLDEPWGVVETFSLLHRFSGGPEERQALEYLTERLERWGVPFRVFWPTCLISRPVYATLRVVVPSERPLRAKTLAFSPSTGGAELIGELVVMSGQGESAELFGAVLPPELPDLRGKVVLVEGFGFAAQAVRWAATGALAVVFVHPGDAIHEGIATTSWGSPDLDAEGTVPAVPVLAIARPDGEALRALAAQGPVTVAVSTMVETEWRPLPVLVAEIPGTQAADEFVLLHGHLDSWHVGVGDNATGDAALLELARVFWQHRELLARTVRIAWWSGHSHGRYAGSTWYADAHAQDLVPNCVAHVNCDSPGCREASEYRDVAAMAEAAALVRTAIRDLTGKEATTARPPRAGDYSFTNLGITGCLMLSSTMPEELRQAKGYYRVGGCGGNIVWHTEDDTIEVADPDVLLRDIRVYAAVVLRLANAPIHPLDFRATVREIEAALYRYQEAAGEAFDLRPALQAAGNLLTTLDRFYEHTATLLDRPVDDPEVRRMNGAQRALARHLVPVNYVRRGRFRHDPAEPIPPVPEVAAALELPRLAPGSDRWHRVRTHLLRGQNQVVWSLRQAHRRIAELLS